SACAARVPRFPISTVCGCAPPMAGGCCAPRTRRTCWWRGPKPRTRRASPASRRCLVTSSSKAASRRRNSRTKAKGPRRSRAAREGSAGVAGWCGGELRAGARRDHGALQVPLVQRAAGAFGLEAREIADARPEKTLLVGLAGGEDLRRLAMCAGQLGDREAERLLGAAFLGIGADLDAPALARLVTAVAQHA